MLSGVWRNLKLAIKEEMAKEMHEWWDDLKGLDGWTVSCKLWKDLIKAKFFIV